jgi:D-glycero-beta-D-manno-heptose 1-phosphate adenylyltransferase
VRTSLKIIPFEALAEWRECLPVECSPLAVTNGCFDVLHSGHVHTLTEARKLGAHLLVGITGDAGVRELKGAGRPIFAEGERAELIAALEVVDAVCIFPERDAVEFLRRARPDVYMKGGGYDLESINQDERRLLEAMGARIEFAPQRTTRSTSGIIEQMQR